MSVTATIFLQDPNFIIACYIAAFSLFIVGLSRLTSPTTAVQGNKIAAVGMAIAVIATLLNPDLDGADFLLIAVGLAIGTAVGVPSARNVKMTAMPQMVALFNGVGGGAVALIAWAEFRQSGGDLGADLAVGIPLLFGAIIGSISFWGSNIAFGKLQGLISGSPVKIPGGLFVNVGLLLVAIGAAIAILTGSEAEGLFVLILVAAGMLGNLAVLPIGGADMPVVISTLNAFTGLSAAAAGIALHNTALIVAGMIVGASGTILTDQMAKAMNRSIGSVLMGGFGGEAPAVASGPGGETGGTVRSTSAADVAILMNYARQVVVVPGYGMAVAQAQHAVREMAKALEKRNIEVKYAIHPVAGRMPGHMNVLLAEADVPYDQLKEMDDINPEFGRTDVAIVIGANDVTNPDARLKADSPIYGMPILNVDEAKQVIVLKRSMASGFAGIENPLFYNEKTQMLFGDAKASVAEITSELGQL
ncbi:MAG TPA: NAD(P)(+) transhydrogenase (Re/Si-specific) subunit beta [Solirubrobacteraceae bacterium]|jgi:NAD(P) transhydrogenase subunit beta|nr:NAD(P)(+) transhydrogenase (Re/Si-specific) subunit beta [Solirubrobacteraceae bacterium]